MNMKTKEPKVSTCVGGVTSGTSLGSNNVKRPYKADGIAGLLETSYLYGSVWVCVKVINIYGSYLKMSSEKIMIMIRDI